MDKSYVNRILFVKRDHSPLPFFQELQKCNISNICYLKRLNAFIGLFQKNSTDNFRYHPDLFQIEEDIEVHIHLPAKGKIISRTQVIPWGIERIGADDSWDISQGKGVKVAVVDTGIAFDHADLTRNIKGGTNIINPLLSPYDHNGHGTHVAGTIGAVNNQYGVVGVAPKVSIYAVKAFNKDGTAKLSNIIKAIDWCIDKDMDIINMSFGFNETSPTFREAIVRCYQSGILMVAASGNNGTQGRIEYPAEFQETIGVSSINENNQISSFSTVGPQVDLAGPGENIISTWLNNSFREVSGTSMAVAHVSGAAALLKSRYPRISSNELSYLLQKNAFFINASPISQGAGLVNAKISSY
ncbi:MAG: S8 family peptidase [Vulcanibacillus sp.]